MYSYGDWGAGWSGWAGGGWGAGPAGWAARLAGADWAAGQGARWPGLGWARVGLAGLGGRAGRPAGGGLEGSFIRSGFPPLRSGPFYIKYIKYINI